MHYSLYLREILLEIFDNCYDRPQGKKNLAALARTCKTFKEPALDILWAELRDLTPLVRCLPGAAYESLNGEYALKRPLDEASWHIILSFTRRVRIARPASSCGLTTECVLELSKPPASIASLFPKLCVLDLCSPDEEMIPFLRHFAGPRLRVLDFSFMPDIQDAMDVFGERCPNITTFHYYPRHYAGHSSDRFSNLICRWSKLGSLRCRSVDLNVTALNHLSHLPDLNYLWLEQCHEEVDHIPSGPTPLTFHALAHLQLYASSATSSKLLNRIRLPSIEDLRVGVPDTSELELKTILSALPDACGHGSLLKILVESHAPGEDMLKYHVNSHHLLPLTVFSNILIIHIMVPYGLDVSERELLQLASSWPHLQGFSVGKFHGCTPASTVITPGGFVELLNRCRALSNFCFPFDVRGYTEIPQGHPWRGLQMPKDSTVDVQYSVIEEESVQALAAFFHVAPFPEFKVGFGLREYQFIRVETIEGLLKLYRDRWERVYSLARKLWEESRSS